MSTRYCIFMPNFSWTKIKNGCHDQNMFMQEMMSTYIPCIKSETTEIWKLFIIINNLQTKVMDMWCIDLTRLVNLNIQHS